MNKLSRTASLVSTILLLLLPAIANAYYGDDDYSYQQPDYGYHQTYDPDSGNSYQTESDGYNTHVYGQNLNTGSQWQTNIEPGGDMNGYDSHGNYWTYDRASGNYTNSDGTFCTGHGSARICN